MPENSYVKTSFRFAPDGKYVVYESDESGTFEVYVAAFPSFAVKRKLSIGGGLYPAWSRDGMEIFYRAIDGNMMDVEVHLEATIEASVPKLLFKFGTGNRGNQFAVSGDGKRFLIADSVRQGDVDRPEITLVLNWAADIGRLRTPQTAMVTARNHNLPTPSRDRRERWAGASKLRSRPRESGDLLVAQRLHGLQPRRFPRRPVARAQRHRRQQ
jgi:hypothetical protein